MKWYLTRKGISHRKFGDKERADQLCFNMWLDESELLLPKNKQNLKNSMDLILMKPILDRRDIYQKFINANSWAKKYTATGYEKITKNFSHKNVEIIKEKPTEILWYLLNLVIYTFQYIYMIRKLSNEIVGLRKAYFHPNG